MKKFTQNRLRIPLFLLYLTVPISSIFLIFEYLGYKKIIKNYVEEVSLQTEKFLEDFEEQIEKFIEKMIEMNSELEYWLDKFRLYL